MPGRTRVVVVAEPADEVEHVGVAPHPGRESSEARQRLDGLGVVAAAADVAVDAIGVGPVGLDGHGVEALLADQPLGDLGTLPVELVRAVRGLADQHEAGVADQLQEGIVVVGRAPQRVRGRAQGLDQEVVRQVWSGLPVFIAAAPYRSPVAAIVPTAARSRRSRTSSSVVWEKSSYQSPTA